MELVNILQNDCIVVGASFDNKKEALHEIAKIANKHPVLSSVDENRIYQALTEREELGSTGFGKGIAIPHCRLKGIDGFVMGIVTVPDGVDFDAMDGEPVQLMIFVIAPDSEATEHIRLLSVISKALSIPGAYEELLNQKSPETARESFLRHTADQVDTTDRENQRLFHVIVQEEKLFEQILQIFEAMESSSVIVIEAANTREYLARMPLFSGFWGDAHMESSRIIMASVNRERTNETIRSIEEVAGNLDKRRGVMVMVQDILFAAGSLEM